MVIVTHLNGKAELTTSNAEDRDVRVSKQQITDDERTSEYANKRANETMNVRNAVLTETSVEKKKCFWSEYEDEPGANEYQTAKMKETREPTTETES